MTRTCAVAQRAGDLVGSGEQPAEATGQGTERGGVGAPDEADRSLDGRVLSVRATHHCVRRKRRVLTTTSAGPTAGSSSSPPVTVVQRRRDEPARRRGRASRRGPSRRCPTSPAGDSTSAARATAASATGVDRPRWGSSIDVAHQATCRAAGWRMTDGQAYSLSMTSTVVSDGGEPDELLHPPVVGEAAAMQGLEDVIGDRRSGEPADHLGETPVRADERDRDAPAPADRLQRRDRPVGQHVDRLVEAALGGGDERRGALDVLDDGERRIGEDAERHERHAQQTPERARHVRAEHAAEAHGGDRHADAPADVVGRSPRSRRGVRPNSHVGATAADSSGRVGAPRARPYTSIPLRTTIDSRARLSAAAPSVETAASDVSVLAVFGLARLNGSHTDMWTMTCGLKRLTRARMRSWSCGDARWNSARLSRRRGGSVSIPSSSPTHASRSRCTATRDPRSPPIPLTRTRRPPASSVPWTDRHPALQTA